jgi:ParB family transcriptional regulator, chromosome partitioning protein
MMVDRKAAETDPVGMLTLPSLPGAKATPTSNSILAGATILELDPATIDTSLEARIGFFFPDKAAAFGRLMAVDGQRDLIKVSRAQAGGTFDWNLHVGLHRTRGALLEGLPIYGIAVSGTPEFLRELESSENVHRRKQEPLERAKFVHALCEVATLRIAREHGELKQAQIAIKARWDRVRERDLGADQALRDEAEDTGDKMSLVYGWQESAAEAMGLDKRTVQRALRLYRLLIEPFPPELVRALADHPVVGSNDKQLRDIADLPGENQRRAVIEALLADHELSAEGARVRVGIVGPGVKIAPGHFDKFTGQIKTGWQRLNLHQRRAFVPEIAALMHTPELKRELRDRLNEELGE